MSDEAGYIEPDLRSTAELIEAALPAGLDEEAPLDAYAALAALRMRGSRDVLDAAVDLSKSGDPSRRALGAYILGQLGVPERTFPEECCDALLGLARHDPDDRVIHAALVSLGNLGNERAEPDIIGMRRHPNGEVRYGVAFALFGTSSKRAIRALVELMGDPYPKVRDWATAGIGQIESIDGPQVRDALLRRSGDPDLDTRAEALNGLARRRDKRVVPYLIAELSKAAEDDDKFAEAAKTYLRLSDEPSVNVETLLAMLKSAASQIDENGEQPGNTKDEPGARESDNPALP